LLNIDTECLLNLCQLKWFKLPASKASRAASEDCKPKSYDEIKYLENSSEWYKATDEEIAQLIEFNTWKLVPLPPGRRAIGSTWVFRIKRNANGTITRYKGRLCAQGFSQISGIDYKEIFSPVFRMESFRMFLIIVAARNMHLFQMDVRGAFLNGKLKEKIYMRRAPGYADPEHPTWVNELMQNLYGLKQAGRVWHDVINPFLISLGFVKNEVDPCVYLKWNNNKLITICLYVDNLAVAADDDTDLQELRQTLHKKIQMTDEDPHFMLGINLQRNKAEGSITISQDHQIIELLTKLNRTDCSSTPIPMTSLTISNADCSSPGSEEFTAMKSIPYRETIGSLTHIARLTRPDISFAVSVCSRFLQNPGIAHWNSVKNI
jgi:hypothetical protein